MFAHETTFEVVLLEGKEFIRAYKVHQVPLTVLIGSTGRIVESWQGSLAKEEREEIEDMIGRTLTAEVNQ
jgi:peroxiredoxin